MQPLASALVSIVVLVTAIPIPADAADTVYFAIGERHELTSEILVKVPPISSSLSSR